MEIMNSKVYRRTLAGVLPGGCDVTDWPRVQVMMIAALICCLCVPLYAVDDSHAAWPQWRGPTRDGKVRGTVWPQKLRGGNLKKLWRYSLGPSYSGPIVVGKHVFVTETKKRKYEVVRCLDRDSGAQVWSTQWKGSIRVPFFARSNGSWIRSTPAYDDGYLYVAGIRDFLVCLNTTTGEAAWKLDFVRSLKSPVPTFGFASSPMVIGDYVYVQAGSSVVKVEKNTGQIQWRTMRDSGGMNGSAFSSPTWAALGNREQLVVQTRSTLAGIDPEQGRVLWSEKIPAFRGMNILTPTIIGDYVFTSSYGGRSILFQITAQGQRFSSKRVWNNRSEGYMSSPVVIDGHVYMHLRNQRFACYDLSTGDRNWITRPYGKYWSLVANERQILALDERGDLLLINANSEKFDLVDSYTISNEPTWGHLAIAGNTLFVRELKAIAAYRWERQLQ